MATGIPGVRSDVLWESTTGVVKGIDFVSQHLNHRSDQPTYKSAISRSNPLGISRRKQQLFDWRIARPLDDNGQEQGISCRSNRSVPNDNCYRSWIG